METFGQHFDMAVYTCQRQGIYNIQFAKISSSQGRVAQW
jgi:hypothetical protein